MRKVLFLPLIVLFAMSCSGPAIFYTLENEEEVRNSNNFNSSTPVDRIQLFDAVDAEYYIANGKQLWYSLAGSEQSPWNHVSLPGSYSTHATIPSAAVFGSRLYAVISDYDSDSATTLGYINTPDEELKEVITYNREDVPGSNDFYFYDLKLFPVETGLYISRVRRSWNTQSSSSSSVAGCELFYYSTGDFPTVLDDAHKVVLTGSSTAFIIKDMVSDGTDTYLILNNTGSSVDSYSAGKLFKRANSTTDPFVEVSMSATYSYNRLYYSTNHAVLFLSTRSDSAVHPVLYKVGSGSWQSLEGPDDIQFSSFVDIQSVKSNTILAGTRGDVISGSQSYYTGDGYYEINLTDINNPVLQSNSFSPSSNYNSTYLSGATINDFLFDPLRSKIYASTSENGLWMNRFDSSSDARIWYQE